MTSVIFCPSDHFMLNQPACPVCGWSPPPPLPQGTLLWDPREFSCGIGGPSLESYVRPGILDGVAVYPLRSGEYVGIRKSDGHTLWRSDPSPEFYPRAFHPDRNHLLAVVPDNRPLDQAGNGFLARISPKTGQLERVWESYGFTMCEPVLTADKIIIRTARPKLVALNRRDPSKVVWEVPLRTYKPIPPGISSDLVLAWDGEVTKEEITLKAFHLESGKGAWQAIIDDIDCPPLVIGNFFVYRSQKRYLICIDLANGNRIWQQQFKKIYCPPTAGGGKIYMVVCGSSDVKSLERYTLVCLDPDTGETLWQNPIGIRSQEIVYREDQTLLLGMGEPRLTICSAQDGRILWQHVFGDEKIDRIQTHLVLESGICWVGTYKGEIAAIQISNPEENDSIPMDIDESLNPDKAAIAYALQGKLPEAAGIYLEKLGQPNKAMAIFRHLNDLSRQADIHAMLGDEMTAANLYEKDGKLLEAALNYEKANEPRQALRLYNKLKLVDEVERLQKIVPIEYSDIEALENNGKFPEAGEMALKIKEYEKAFHMFQKAGERYSDQSFEALKLLCETNPETWSLEMLAETARKMGDFLNQAKAYEKLELFDKAAEAYYLAARQLEERSPLENKKIAGLYELACGYFKQEGLEDKQEGCWRKVIFYRKLPWIHVEGQTEKAFREQEFNVLNLVVKNEGFGRADRIKLQVLGNRFEIDQLNLPEEIIALGIMRIRKISLPIRPKEDQVGEVPFTLSWSWLDKNGVEYCSRTTVTVNVKQQHDRRTGGTPVIINAQTYIEGDDRHQEIKGDNLASGAKKEVGDRVEMHRDGQVRIIDSEYGELTPSNLLKKCPNCSLPIENGSQYCTHCGFEVSK